MPINKLLSQDNSYISLGGVGCPWDDGQKTKEILFEKDELVTEPISYEMSKKIEDELIINGFGHGLKCECSISDGNNYIIIYKSFKTGTGKEEIMTKIRELEKKYTSFYNVKNRITYYLYSNERIEYVTFYGIN